MRSRAGSWSLAFVLVLSFLLILGSSNAGFLALAQSDGTPVVEEPVQEEQPPVELATETSVPELPTEVPIPPTEVPIPPTEIPVEPSETPIPPTEPAVLATEMQIPSATATDEAMVEAASEGALALNLSECWQDPYWAVHLQLDQPTFPESLTLEFANGVWGTVYRVYDSWQTTDGYRAAYISYDNVGEQLVSISGAVSAA